MMDRLFKGRESAGQALGEALKGRHLPANTLVLGLTRGGVPVAHRVAAVLGLELDILNLRKLGLPDQPELAMGAIAEDGTRYLDRGLIRRQGVTDEAIARVEARERATLEDRIRRFRAVRPAAEVAGRPVVLVDDGIATGTTMELAVRVMRKRGASPILVAVPVGPQGTAERFGDIADGCVCLLEPVVFNSVGLWYLDFHQVTEEQVLEALEDCHPG